MTEVVFSTDRYLLMTCQDLGGVLSGLERRTSTRVTVMSLVKAAGSTTMARYYGADAVTAERNTQPIEGFEGDAALAGLRWRLESEHVDGHVILMFGPAEYEDGTGFDHNHPDYRQVRVALVGEVPVQNAIWLLRGLEASLEEEGVPDPLP